MKKACLAILITAWILGAAACDRASTKAVSAIFRVVPDDYPTRLQRDPADQPDPAAVLDLFWSETAIRPVIVKFNGEHRTTPGALQQFTESLTIKRDKSDYYQYEIYLSQDNRVVGTLYLQELIHNVRGLLQEKRKPPLQVQYELTRQTKLDLDEKCQDLEEQIARFEEQGGRESEIRRARETMETYLSQINACDQWLATYRAGQAHPDSNLSHTMPEDYRFTIQYVRPPEMVDLTEKEIERYQARREHNRYLPDIQFESNAEIEKKKKKRGR